MRSAYGLAAAVFGLVGLALASCNPLADEASSIPEASVDTVSLSDSPSAFRKLSYVAIDGGLRGSDIDHGYRLVERIELSGDYDAVNPRGIAADPETDRIYVSYWGKDPNSGTGRLIAFDLSRGEVAYSKEYSPSVDSFALSGDGRKIYLPCSEHSDCDWWWVLDARTGRELGRITVTRGTHNTIYGLSGSRVYLASLLSPTLAIVDTETDEIVDEVGPFRASIRPFTINSSETLAFVNVDFLSGFEVGDLASGEVLHTVEVDGFPLRPTDFPDLPVTQSHGIALSPDETEVWVADDFYDYLHVFNTDGLPGEAPRQVADVALSGSPKWINFTRDGRAVHVSTGEIIDARTHETIGLVEPSRIFLEVHQRGDRIIAAFSRYGLGYRSDSSRLEPGPAQVPPRRAAR